MKLCDLTGKRFGNLTVLSRADDYITPKGCHKTQWLCKCVCGKRIITLATHLKSGHTSSCGCSHAKYIKFNRYDLSGEYGIGFATIHGHVIRSVGVITLVQRQNILCCIVL